MPTRLVRTDTIANIVDFGAISTATSNEPAYAPTNSAAFRAAIDYALTTGSRKIAIPAGIFPFEDIEFDDNPWLPHGIEIFGQGTFSNAGIVNGTILRYFPIERSPGADPRPAFQFYPGGNGSHSTLRDLTLWGPVDPTVNVPPEAIGISMHASHFNRVRDVSVWHFDIGVQFNEGVTSPATFSAYNVLERFTINRCRTGIRVGDATNGNVIRNGRVFYSLVQYDDEGPGDPREEGIGIDVDGVYADAPVGGRALVISGVDIESAATCLRILASRDIAVIGGFFEAGSLVAAVGSPPVPYPYGERRRRSLDIDDLTEGLTFVGSHFSEPSIPPTGEQDWTPTYIAIPPEVRGVIDASSAGGSGTAYDVDGRGGGISGTTAAHANRIKNADFSRGAMFWNASGSLVIAPNQTTYVTGGASLALQVVASPTENINQDFAIDSGVRTVTVNVRYQLFTAGVHAFRVDLFDVSSATRIGFFSDVGPGPTGWRVRSLTGRFDGLSGGVVGPRRLRVRVFPYAGPLSALEEQEVLVDSVWLVDGEYAASYRPYAEDVELLIADEREAFFVGQATTSPVGPTAAGPTNVPSNAIGMVVEMWIAGADATATPTILRVNDLSGTLTTRDLHAFVSGRPTMIEYTLPFSGGTPPQWTVVGGSMTNVVDYSVRLKKWILRP